MLILSDHIDGVQTQSLLTDSLGSLRLCECARPIQPCRSGRVSCNGRFSGKIGGGRRPDGGCTPPGRRRAAACAAAALCGCSLSGQKQRVGLFNGRCVPQKQPLAAAAAARRSTRTLSPPGFAMQTRMTSWAPRPPSPTSRRWWATRGCASSTGSSTTRFA